MTLREGAALGILAREPHPVTLGQQRAEGERLRGRPVDVLPRVDRLAAVLKEAQQRAVQMKARLERSDLLANLLELGNIDAGLAATRIFRVARGLEAGPAAVEPIGFVGAITLRGFELGIEAAAPIRLHLLDFAGG